VKVAQAQAEGRSADGYWAVITALCRDVRTLVSADGSRLFGVYDTALEDNVSHADICQAYVLPPNAVNRNAENKRVRARLYEVFGRRAISLEEAYGLL
jgi:hypothetical protein